MKEETREKILDELERDRDPSSQSGTHLRP